MDNALIFSNFIKNVLMPGYYEGVNDAKNGFSRFIWGGPDYTKGWEDGLKEVEEENRRSAQQRYDSQIFLEVEKQRKESELAFRKACEGIGSYRPIEDASFHARYGRYKARGGVHDRQYQSPVENLLSEKDKDWLQNDGGSVGINKNTDYRTSKIDEERLADSITYYRKQLVALVVSIAIPVLLLLYFCLR